MPWWLRRIADELDLSVNDESEMRGVVKGLVLGLLTYVSLLVLVTLAYQRTQGG